MKFSFLIVAVILMLNFAYANQLLNKGYFFYNNLSVENGGRIVVGINTTSNVDLIVMHSSSYGSFINNGGFTTLYNSSVGTGIYQLNFSGGNYTVIFQAVAPTRIEAQAIAVPYRMGREFTLSGKYIYNFSLSNYSNVNVTLLADRDYSAAPIVVNVSGVGTKITGNTNLAVLPPISDNMGLNNVTITSPTGMQMFILVNTTPQLVNPLLDVYGGNNYSIGVASYGLYNVSGVLYPYQVKTNEVIGVANISVLSVYNSNPGQNTSANGASLQLNVGLNTQVGNNPRVFWLQDVVDFNTSSDTYYLVDNIWNNTGPTANLTSYALVGGGNDSVCVSCNNQTFYADSYPSYYFNYSLPLRLKLVILENQTPAGSKVYFGYQVLQNGTYGLGPLIFFDSVLIPGSNNSVLLTTPYYKTPGGGTLEGSYYDSELVFGGEASGVNAQFDGMRSSLWIYYNDSGQVVPFPSVYTFGLSTAESASDLQSGAGPQGALVTLGTPNLTADLLTSNGLNSIADYVSSTSKYTSVTTTVPYGSGNPFQVNSVPQSEIEAFEIILVVAIAFIVIVGFYLVKRK